MGWNAVFILVFIVVLGVIVYKLTKSGKIDDAVRGVKEDVKEAKDEIKKVL